MDGEDEIAEIERDLFSKLKRVKRNRAIYGRGLKQNNKNNGASFTLLYQSYILSQPTRLNPVVIRGSSALERTLGRQREETWIDDPGFNIRKKSVNRGKFWNISKSTKGNPAKKCGRKQMLCHRTTFIPLSTSYYVF